MKKLLSKLALATIIILSSLTALVVETYPGEADYGTCYQIALNVMHGNYLALGQ